MPEPPSAELQELLSRLHLCGPADLRRCRARVKRLARDLPAFDSVWLDALVQARVLTAFQATVLASRTPECLSVGAWVLVEKLGGGAWSETFAARASSGKQRCALKRLVVPSDTRRGVFQGLQQLVRDGQPLPNASVVVPRVVWEVGGQLVTGSPLIEGVTLRDLLVRRGRFPANVVEDIGAALHEGLAVLHRHELVHGDVVLHNVRLTRQGEVVMVDAGIKPALEPRFLLDATRPPDCYDGIAPERIEAGGAATEASDAYGLGCLLWELLAGRPPYPSGDPLAKLTAHQHDRIVDVREWAPEAPARLAGMITRLCDRDPGQRGLTGDPGVRWRNRRGGAARRVSGFLARFRTAAPTRTSQVRDQGARKWPAAIAITVIAGLGALGYLSGLIGDPPNHEILLRLTKGDNRQQPRTNRPEGNAVTVQNRTTRASVPWPKADRDGVIRLGDGHAWPAIRVEQAGRLVITAEPGTRPVIEPGEGRSLTLSADEILLRGVTLRRSGTAAALVATTNTLILEECTFTRGQKETPRKADKAAAVALVAAADRGLSVSLRDVISHDNGAFLGIGGEASARVTAVDCLAVGGGSWLTWVPPQASRGRLSVRLEHVTLRRAGSLLEIPARAGRGNVTIETTACVLALREGQWLCRGAGRTGVSVALLGEHTLVNPATRMGDGGMEVEGLVTAAARFRGPASSRRGDSVLSRLPEGVPHSGRALPGVRAVDEE